MPVACLKLTLRPLSSLPVLGSLGLGGGMFRTGGRGVKGVKGVKGLCHTHPMTTTFYQIACTCDSHMYPYSD